MQKLANFQMCLLFPVFLRDSDSSAGTIPKAPNNWYNQCLHPKLLSNLDHKIDVLINLSFLLFFNMMIYWDRKVPECATCSPPYQSLPHLTYYNLVFVTLSLLVCY